MKTMMSKCLFGMAALSLTAVSLMAGPTRRIVLQVPFAFIAGSTHLPAGQYAVTQDDTGKAIYVMNLATGVSVVVLPESSTSMSESSQSSVNFVKTGNEYHMKVIRIAGAQGVMMRTAR